MSDLGSATPSTRRRAKVKSVQPTESRTPSQELLHALQAMRSGDFSVRMTGDHLGIDGKIADTFNEIVAANQRMAQQLERVGQVVGREGKTRQRVKFGLGQRLMGRHGRLGQHADRRSALADPRSDARGRRGRAGRPAANRAARCRRPPAGRRILAVGHHRQHHDQAAQRVHLRGDARGARGRHRGQARRPGAGAGSDRRLEGPDRERQLDGQQPDRPGPQHRRGHHRGRQRRPVQEDHGRRPRRNPAAEGSHQHHGGPAALVRLRSDPRRPRSRHRRQARRPGDRARRRRHLEGPHRLRERDVRQSDRAGAQHRQRHHRGRARRPVAQDHGRRARRNSGAEGHHQHDGRPAQLVRIGSDPRRPRSRHRRQARRPGPGARRRRHLEGPHRQRQLHGDEPDRAGPQHRRCRDRDRRRRPLQEDHGERVGRNPSAEGNAQHHGRPAQRLCRRGDARRARGRHRRPARRPGQRARRRRHLEGPDRERQLDGEQPDGAGPQHRRGDDRGRQWRPVQEDHGGRARRNSRAEEHHQHHGRPAQRLCRRSDARGARGRHRRQARRSGAGARRRRHLEGSDRQRQLDGQQPDRPGPQHRRGRNRGGQGRPVEKDHRERVGRNPAAEGNAQHHGRPAQRLCRRSDARRARGRHRRQARRPGRGAPAWPAPGRTSPTASTRWPAT